MCSGLWLCLVCLKDDYVEALGRLHLTVTRAYKVNPDINFEVFIHKVDGLSDDHKIETQRDIHQRANDDLADASLEKLHLRWAWHQSKWKVMLWCYQGVARSATLLHALHLFLLLLFFLVLKLEGVKYWQLQTLNGLWFFFFFFKERLASKVVQPAFLHVWAANRCRWHYSPW